MTRTSEFSVVISLYNKESFIRRALESVLHQTALPHEVVVVDDGSTDSGADLVRDLFPQVKLVRQQNLGPGRARNTGVNLSRGRWIAFLDADDYWAPFHVEDLERCLSLSSSLGLIGTGYVEVSNPNREPHLVREGDPYLLPYFRVAGRLPGFIHTSAAAIHRAAFHAAGGFSSSAAGEDLGLWVRVALNSPVGYCPAESAVYVRGVNGIMATLEARSADAGDGDKRLVTMVRASESFRVVADFIGKAESERRDLVDYLDRRSLGAVRAALAHNDVAQARAFRAGIRNPWIRLLHPLSALTRLPSTAVNGIVRLRRWMVDVSQQGVTSVDARSRGDV